MGAQEVSISESSILAFQLQNKQFLWDFAIVNEARKKKKKMMPAAANSSRVKDGVKFNFISIFQDVNWFNNLLLAIPNRVIQMKRSEYERWKS